MYILKSDNSNFAIDGLQDYIKTGKYDIFIWIEDDRVLNRAIEIWQGTEDYMLSADVTIRTDDKAVEIDLYKWEQFIERLDQLDLEFDAKMSISLYDDRSMNTYFNVHVVKDLSEDYFD